MSKPAQFLSAADLLSSIQSSRPEVNLPSKQSEPNESTSPARQLRVNLVHEELPTGAQFANVVINLSAKTRTGDIKSFFLTIHPREIDELINQLKDVQPQALALLEEIEQERNAMRDFDGVRRPVMRPGKTARDRESVTRGSAPTNVPTVSQAMKGKRVGGDNGKGKGKR